MHDGSGFTWGLGFRVLGFRVWGWFRVPFFGLNGFSYHGTLPMNKRLRACGLV